MRHECEHRKPIAFTYTVISRDQSQHLNYIYIYPLSLLVNWLRTNGNDDAIFDDFDAIVSF